ncbi:MAG: Peptidyl-prolyl cis-trans isomerase B [Watsoniomyces obsoletus]|nr:MAG: Peptidyl-prolyl cis-trans isomerase B [Watsoniomyces obsoletus]
MPMKFSKGFQRRKSGGNSLDKADPTSSAGATPSFRVLERPAPSSTSFDGGNKLVVGAGRGPVLGATDHLRGALEEQPSSAQNRGSGGSNTNSTSTATSHDHPFSSRLSSSSTVPSSAGLPTPDDPQVLKQSQSALNMPISQEPEPALSLRAGSRTFSFGARAGKLARSAFSRPSIDGGRHADDTPPASGLARNRAMTESSYASTTTPPKLETDVGTTDLDGLSNIFDDIGKRKSAILQGGPTSAPANDRHPVSDGQSTMMSTDRRLTLAQQGQWVAEPAELDEGQSYVPIPLTKPAPIHFDGPADNVSSPRSLKSRTSNDMLLHSAPTSASAIDSFSDADLLAISRRETDPPRAFPSDEARRSQPTTPAARSSMMSSGGLKRSSAYRDRRSNGTLDDEDTRLLSDPTEARTASHQKTSSLSPRRLVMGSRGSRDDVMQATTPETVKRSSNAPGTTTRWQENDGIELSQLSARSTEKQPLGVRTSQTEPIQSNSRFLSASASSPSLTPPPDAARSTLDPAGGRLEPSYRARVSDEIPSARLSDGSHDPPSRTATPPSAMYLREPSAHVAPASVSPTAPRSPQRPSLANQPGRGSYESEQQPAPNADDDDEDVPLGILAAHGFPSKTRTLPVRMSKVGSTPNLRTMSMLDGRTGTPSSVAGEPTIRDARHSHLPVFARGLPQDPYGGPGPSHPSESTALALGRNSLASASMVDLPPGGLIGVIAGEERNRAMRRGNPSMHNGLASMGMSNAGFTGGLNAVGPWMPAPAATPFGNVPRNTMMMNGPMPPGFMPGMSPADQAQLQMSQQMTEMMWMQMMWMQQMMQMQGVPAGGQQQPMMAPGAGPAQFGPPPPQPPSINVIPTLHPSRPASVRASSAAGMNMNIGMGGGIPGGLQMHQRTMSMLDPSMSLSNPGVANQQQQQQRFSQFAPSFLSQTPLPPGYAASIAPSERSNVGLPSRYRPVSSAVAASPIEPMSAPPGVPGPGLDLSFMKSPDHMPPPVPTHATTPSPISGGGPKPPAVEDEDDEHAWEEMKRAREKKKMTWKFKKDSSPVRDVFVPNI